jgi:hypothetical protein
MLCFRTHPIFRIQSHTVGYVKITPLQSGAGGNVR